MYGQYRSRFITRLLMGFCFFVWLVVGCQIVVFAQTVEFNGLIYTISDTVTQGGIVAEKSKFVYYPISDHPTYLVRGSLFLIFVGPDSSGKWAKFNGYSIISSVPVPPDTDNDGVPDNRDPCPNTADSNFNIYRVGNSCDGGYFWFQVTGECGKTKNNYNPKYNSMNEAVNDSKVKIKCTDVATLTISAKQLADFWASTSTNSSAVASAPDNATAPISFGDITGATGVGVTNSTYPKSDDNLNQELIDSIEQLKNDLKGSLDSNSAKALAQGIANTDRIVNALASDRTAANNINNGVDALRNAASAAASQAHNDAQDLKKAIENIKPSNATASSSGGITGEDLDDSFTKDREATWGTSGNTLNTDTGSAASGFAGALGSWSDTVSSRFSTLVPSMSIQTVSVSPCLDAGVITDSSGHSYQFDGICLDKFSTQFEMVGNILFAFVGITCVLNLFRLRG